ncbi:MAG: SCO family protein [Gammaproteobacteria bacterium]|nr:SCO family protein [Gammaproteobacteria bacterium]
MQNSPVISNTKLITLIVFICAALITSLFVYHSAHKKELTQLSDDRGIVFPVPRDIKTFDLLKHNQASFKPVDFRNHWTLLFFGFTHCTTICPTTLHMLKNAYTELHPRYPNLQVILVSLDPHRDTLTELAAYTTSFHSDFVGVTGKLQEIRKLQSQLGVFAARDEATSDDDYQIQHTSSVMLINPQGKWAGLFQYGMSSKEFVHAFNEAMQKQMHDHA